MRLRLFHKLALVTTLLMALTIAALAGVTIRNLRNGFNSYLDERDQEQLTTFAGVVREAMEKNAADAQAHALNLHTLLYEQARRQDVRAAAARPRPNGLPPARPSRQPNSQNGAEGEPGPPGFGEGPPPGFPPEGGFPPGGPPPGMEGGPPPEFPGDRQPSAPDGGPTRPAGPPDSAGRRPPPRRLTGPSPAPAAAQPDSRQPPNLGANLGPNLGLDAPGRGFGNRVNVLAPDGHVLTGPTFAKDQPVIVLPVISNGRLLARVQLVKVKRASEGLDERFLRNQVVAIVVISGIAFVLSLGGILLLSRQLAKPLRAAQSATARIASGDFAVRLTETGTDEVADLVRNINAMARSLETLEHARKNWLAQLSHELRTPLTVLQGECEAMMDGVRPVSVEAIAGLHERALALNRIVEDLHMVSLADLGALPHVFLDLDAVELVEHVLAKAEHRLAKHGLAAALLTAPAMLPVGWDAGRITQLLENLLENSLRYTDRPGQIQISLASDGEMATLRWEDSPPGVAAEELEHLFEPLYRANTERSRSHGGSGLGLAICRAIVAVHRGSIRAEVSPLGGVCILIVLPLFPAGG
jgi:two-component system sensor histidine kinase BaeS